MPESITCPRCKRTSHNPNDVLNKYCGACFRFHDEEEILRKRFLKEGRSESFAKNWAKNIGLITMRGQCLCGDPKCDWSCPKGANHPMQRPMDA